MLKSHSLYLLETSNLKEGCSIAPLQWVRLCALEPRPYKFTAVSDKSPERPIQDRGMSQGEHVPLGTHLQGTVVKVPFMEEPINIYCTGIYWLQSKMWRVLSGCYLLHFRLSNDFLKYLCVSLQFHRLLPHVWFWLIHHHNFNIYLFENSNFISFLFFLFIPV